MLVVEQVRTVVPGVSLIVAEGAEVFDVIVILFVAVHPVAAVTVTVYVPAAVRLFAAVAGVDPPDQA
jgi:hypothetical protein